MNQGREVLPLLLVLVHEIRELRRVINDNYSCRRIASPDLLPGEHRCLRISATEGRHDVDDQSGGAAGVGDGGGRAVSAQHSGREGWILDEFVALTGYHRKHAIRVPNGRAAMPTVPRGRRCVYDEAVTEGLIVLWEASDRMCGKRMKALLPILVPALERHGHLSLDPGVRERLMAVSAATIDRRLAPARAVTAGQRRPRRSRLDGVRGSVPVRTFGDWQDPAPGFVEADLVAHCGRTMAGSVVSTLVLTDIASGWTECVSLLVREAQLVVDAVDQLRGALPFTLRGIDTDNGSEFVNKVLVAFCKEHGIELTRSRPYRKNDQAWVEQKNGAVVRRLVGYGRLEGMPAAEALARLYSAARLFVNVFQPSFKLAEKTRDGARVRQALPCAGDAVRAVAGVGIGLVNLARPTFTTGY